MENLEKFKENKLKSPIMTKIYGQQKIYTTLGDPEKPEYKDVHNDNDNDGKWSSGDTYVITKLIAAN